MHLKFLSLVLIVSFLLSPSTFLGCTAFCLKNDKQLLLAKNLDWDINDGIILINKKGIKKRSYGNNYKTLAWTSKYGSITFNQFGKEFPLGGMNEKGLVIEELNSWGETPNTEKKFVLNEFQWIQYCLDNFENVSVLIESMKDIVIVPLFINLHYLISDNTGNTTIIEFYDGQAHIFQGHDIIYPVLSNNHYENSLKYIQNFKGFGGNMDAKLDNTSGERFLKTVTLLKEKTDFNSKTAFKILDNVKQKDTQWSIVYDLKDKVIEFKTSESKIIKKIELSLFDFTCNTPTEFIDINTDLKTITNEDFRELKYDDNKYLLLNVYEKYRKNELGDVDRTDFLKLSQFGSACKCE